MTQDKKKAVLSFRLIPILSSYLGRYNDTPETQAAVRIVRLQKELEHLTASGPRAVGVHHASALHLGSKTPEVCMRKLAYAVRYRTSSSLNNLTPKDILTFETGHDFHSMVQGWCYYFFGMDFQAEVPINIPDLRIIGSCDGVLNTENEGCKIRVGLEIKTIGPDSYETLVKKDGKPKSGHLDQGAVYVHGLDLDGISFIYENKGTHAITEYFYTREMLQERWEMIKNRIVVINQHLDNNTHPIRLVSRWECNKCRFQPECKPFVQGNIAGSYLRVGDSAKRR